MFQLSVCAMWRTRWKAWVTSYSPLSNHLLTGKLLQILQTIGNELNEDHLPCLLFSEQPFLVLDFSVLSSKTCTVIFVSCPEQFMLFSLMYMYLKVELKAAYYYFWLPSDRFIFPKKIMHIIVINKIFSNISNICKYLRAFHNFVR